MTNWRKTVPVSEVLRNDDLSLVEKAKEIEKRFAASGLYRTYHGVELLDLVGELKEEAKTGDPDAFDGPLEGIYDWCDRDRVWCGP